MIARVVAVTLLCCASAALAATPKHGASFHGRLSGKGAAATFKVSFTVSSDGRRINGMSVTDDNCMDVSGFKRLAPFVFLAPIAVTHSGTFNSTQSSSFLGVTTTATVSGRFGSSRQVTGTFKASQRTDTSCRVGPFQLSAKA